MSNVLPYLQHQVRSADLVQFGTFVQAHSSSRLLHKAQLQEERHDGQVCCRLEQSSCDQPYRGPTQMYGQDLQHMLAGLWDLTGSAW